MSKKKRQPVLNVKDFEGKFPAAILNSESAHPDPAADWPGAPPNFGRDLVPHIYTVSGWVGSQARAYPLEDEALRASPTNAENMRRDPDIKECLLARQRAVALLPWSLIPEDEQDPRQKQLCTDLTTILERSRRFTEMRRYLMEAIWYGKSFVQLRYAIDWVGGQQRKIIKEWEPRHSDKIVFRYSDGTTDYQAGQVGIRVHAGYKHIRPEQIQPTQYGLAYWLRDWERRLCIVHKHEIEDGPYQDPWMSGRIHGVGIRDSVYWTWVASKNVEANLLEYIERTALGIEIWRYPSGNAEAEAKARTAAEERFNNGRSVIMVPVIPGEQADLFGVQHIEPSPAGADLLLTICQQFYAHKIKRLILGQTLSSEAQATGMGSGVADAHLATYADIIRYDALNLQETLTDDLVKTAKEENFPWARKVHIRCVLSTDDPEVQEKLGALQAAWNMGLKLRAEDLYQLVGARRPDEEDDELENPGIANGKLQVAMGMQQMQMQSQQMAMQQAQAQQMAQAQASGQAGPDGQPMPPGQPGDQASPPMEVAKESADQPGAQAVNPWAGFWDSLFAAARGQGVQPPAGAAPPNGKPVLVDQGELSRIFDERLAEAQAQRQATAQDLYDALVAAVDQQPDATALRDQLRFLFVWTDATGKDSTPYGDPWGALTAAFAGRAIADGIANGNGPVHSVVKPGNSVNGPRAALLAALQARFGGTPERYDQEHPTDIIAGTDHYAAGADQQVERYADRTTWWHGSPSGDLRGAKNGLHVGTKRSAEEALHSRIGIPAEGTWDGTREYGKTLLAGKKRLLKRDPRGYLLTGYNADLPDEDHYPSGQAHYSDGSAVPPEAKPVIFPLRIIGPMTNTPQNAHADSRANGLMRRQIAAGKAKRGFYYLNDGEDAGSISAAVPSGEHIQRIDEPRDYTKEAAPETGEPEDYALASTTTAGSSGATAKGPSAQPANPLSTEHTNFEAEAAPETTVDEYAAEDAEDWSQGVKIDPASLSREVLSRIHRTMKAKGYDSRGPEDARRAIASMINRETGLLRHPDWVEAYHKATGGVKARKDKLAQQKAQQAKLTRVNWDRLKQLGTTTDYREAGYLAPEGHMIDLSGKRAGYVGPPMRNYDHREAGGTAGMQELMSAGHIRHMPENNGLDMMVRPTDKQWGHIRNIAGRSGGEMVLDLQDGLGEWDERSGYYQDSPRRWSAQYPKGTRFERIQRDISSFYDGQDPPPPPEARYTEKQSPDAILARYRAGEISSEEFEQYALTASC